jgi:hypothetical protein
VTTMSTAVSRIPDLLCADHERLDELLRRAMSAPPADVAAYEAFRGGLLRHIGIEEKILIPFVRRQRPDLALDAVKQLRLDHAALAALLVPTPTTPILERIRAVVAAHNSLEEGEGGFYEVFGGFAASDEAALLERIERAPAVPLAVHYDGPRAFVSIERLLRAAGRGSVPLDDCSSA